MAKYFFIQEWNESDVLPHGRCTSKVTAYGLMSERRIKELKYYANRYSPYDYVDYSTFTNEEKYKIYLKIIEGNGGTITYE